jgi:hypothetical protein
VVTTTPAPVISFVIDGTKALWTQFAGTGNSDVLLEAPLVPGAAASPLLGGSGPPEPVLRGVDAANAYLVGPRDRPSKAYRLERQSDTLHDAVVFAGAFGPLDADDVYVTPSALYFFADELASGRSTLYSIPKAELTTSEPPEPLLVAQAAEFGGLTPVGTDGDAVVFIDSADGVPTRASRTSRAAAAEVAPVFADAPGAALPRFFQFGGDADRLYAARSDDATGNTLLQTVPRDRNLVADLVTLSANEGDCFDIRSDGTYVYWLVRASTRQTLRAIVKDGSRGPRDISNDVGPAGYAVHDGYAYWVSADSRSIFGKRVH